MKQLILSLGLLAGSLIAYCQQTNTQHYIDQYCSLNIMPRLLSNKVNIEVDYGNPKKLFSFKDNRVKDDDGRAKKFNTAVEVLNYMSTQGWKLVNAMALTEGGTNVYRYIMKREIEVSGEEKTKVETDANKN
jgi:hypothetical protein